MKKQIRIIFATVLIIAFIATLLIWTSSASHFYFTHNLTLQNINTENPSYFQNGPAYQTINNIKYQQKTVGQIEFMIGPPYVNSSEIPIIFQVIPAINFKIDSIEVKFSSSIHKPLTYQPDFYLKPTSEADSQLIELSTSYPYANEVTLKVNHVNIEKLGEFYRELIFSPINPDNSKLLEFNFRLLISMHENSIIQLTSLVLDSQINLVADKLYSTK